MREIEPAQTPGGAARLRLALAASLLAATVAACGGDSLRADSTFGKFLRGTTRPPTTIDPATFQAPLVCPRVKILPETEAIRITEKGSQPDGGELRWLARIDKTARECSETGSGGVTARVGIAGRALAGPKGGVGVVKLPIRVAVREGDAVTYSKLHVVDVDLTSTAGQDFAFVDEVVPIGDRQVAEILVGFDESGR